MILPLLPGQHDVGEQEIHALVAAKNLKRLLSLGSLEYAVSELAQDHDAVGAHVVVVLEDQHRFVPLRLPGASFSSLTGLVHAIPVKPWKVQFDGRSLSRLAVYRDVAAGLLDEAVDHAEAEPGSLSGLFRGEKGFENPGFHVGDMPMPVSEIATTAYWPGMTSAAGST